MSHSWLKKTSSIKMSPRELIFVLITKNVYRIKGKHDNNILIREYQ